MATAYTHLLSPGRIGTMSLRNRIFLTAMGVNLADRQGNITPRIRDFCAEVAKGGAAMVNLGVAGVDWPIGGNQPNQIAISDDRFIPGFRSVAEAVHAHGAKLTVQLHFGGLVGMEDAIAGRPTWTPSVPPVTDSKLLDGFTEKEMADGPFGKIKGPIDYKVMSKQDIQYLVQKFAAGADRALRAGADGVEIHGGHGYIISSFLSPYINQRTDEYGGSIENRARFLVEIIRGIRDAVGRDFPVWCKIDSQEFGLEGITLEDAKTTARLAQNAGSDAITVTSYQDSSVGVLHSGSHTPDVPGWTLDNAAAIKAAVDIPIIASGRVEVGVAEKQIAEGRSDFIAMGRKLLADPYLPKKLTEGRGEEIRPCIYCYTCISEIYVGRSTICAVNPEMSFERELAVVPAATKKKVAVIGGGPAGMETARRLALKGHKVTLLEQTNRLGGTLQFASIAYTPNEGLLDWLKQEIGKSGVDIRLSTSADVQLLKSLQVDEVVVATGAVRKMPPIPGADRPNVFSGDDMRKLVLGEDLDQLKGKTGWTTRLTAKAASLTGATKSPELIRQATKTWMPLGDRIVIIGGELVALELAEFLAHRGRKVAVVDEVARFGAGLPIVRRWRVLDELAKLDVPLYGRATEISIGEGEVSYRSSHQQIRRLAADHVIVAKGAVGDLSLAETLRTAGFKVRTVGDCNGVGYIAGAMRSAAEAATAI